MLQQASTKFDHIAVGVPDPSALTPFLVGALGGTPYSAGPGSGFTWFQYQFGSGGVLEVLEPAGPTDGFLHRFLAARGPGVHHVTFKVPDHREVVERATALGYDVVGVDDSSPSWKEAFLHPKQALGVVVQIVETSGGDADANAGDGDAEDGPHWERPDFPHAPAAATVPTALVGLRCNAHSESAARRQWQTLLGAECSEHEDALVFEWNGSPMRIHTTVDALRPEGPIALEVERSPQSRLLIPEGPHPLLGTAIVPVHHR